MRHEQVIRHNGRDYTFTVETRPEPNTSHTRYLARLNGTVMKREQLGPFAHDQYVDMIVASTTAQPKFGHAPITRVNLRNYHATEAAAAKRAAREFEEFDDGI